MSTERWTLRQMASMIWHVGSLEGRTIGEAIETEQKRRIESFRLELKRIIGEGFDFNIRINGGCIEAEIEDLCFIAFEFTIPRNQEHLTLVTLLGRCPSCGVETISEPFGDLSGLGKMLERFKPLHKHLCYGQSSIYEQSSLSRS